MRLCIEHGRFPADSPLRKNHVLSLYAPKHKPFKEKYIQNSQHNVLLYQTCFRNCRKNPAEDHNESVAAPVSLQSCQRPPT